MAVPFSFLRAMSEWVSIVPVLFFLVSCLFHRAFIVFFSFSLSPSLLVLPSAWSSMPVGACLLLLFSNYLRLLYFQYSFVSHLLAPFLPRSHLASSFPIYHSTAVSTFAILRIFIILISISLKNIYSLRNLTTYLLLLLSTSSTPYLLSHPALFPSRTPILCILNVPHLSLTLHSPPRNPYSLISYLYSTFASDIVSLTPFPV